MSYGFLAFTILTSQSAVQAKEPARITIDELAPLVGSWDGKLTYLDYSDNRTRSTIGASFTCKRSGDGYECAFGYIEPNGKTIDGESRKLSIGDQGREFRLGDETWRVVSKPTDSKSSDWSLVLERRGTDNRKPADFRRTVKVSGDSLSIRTEVRTDGAESTLLRNEYVLKKRKP